MKNHYYNQFAKSMLSLALAASMMIPSPVALAAVVTGSAVDGAEPPNQASSSETNPSTTENNGNQTTVSFVGTGSEAYTVTVPAQMAPGETGEVKATGTWASNRSIQVSAEENVVMTNPLDIRNKSLTITFEGINQPGNNEQAIETTKQISVEEMGNVLFGTWSGVFHYHVGFQDASNPGGGGTTTPIEPQPEQKPLTGISLSESSIEYDLDGESHSKQLSVIFSPEDTTDDKTVTWESNNPAIATVENGLVSIGTEFGIATITATCGTHTATCKVIVASQTTNPFTVTSSNRAAIGYTGAENENLVIPETFIGDGNNGTVKGQKYQVTTIGSSAFITCSGLVSVTIPDSVTGIGSSAFYQCKKLTEVNLSNNLTTIRDSAFLGTNLTSLAIPESVTVLGKSVFSGCPIESIVIPKSLTYINQTTFANCKNLKSVLIPDSVQHIERRAFYNCSSLTSVTIPDSVVDFGAEVFYGCNALTSVKLSNNLTALSSNTFKDCIGLSSIIIPNSITSIEVGAFSNCSSLTAVALPNSITSIGQQAFENCSGLTSITIPNSVTFINHIAFENCNSLTTLIINKPQDSISMAPWGATNATVTWNG